MCVFRRHDNLCPLGVCLTSYRDYFCLRTHALYQISALSRELDNGFDHYVNSYVIDAYIDIFIPTLTHIKHKLCTTFSTIDQCRSPRAPGVDISLAA